MFHYKFYPQVYIFAKSQSFDYVEGIQRFFFSLLFYIFSRNYWIPIDLNLRRLTIYLSNLDLSSIAKTKLLKEEFILALVPEGEHIMVKKEREETD